MPQMTIARAVSCTGVSLHSGLEVGMEFRPAPAGTGIRFHVPAGDGEHVLSPRPEAVSATELATTISDGAVSVSTIEHVLAALRGMGIDNVAIHAAGEVPILDGSAAVITDALEKAGTAVQDEPRTVARVARSIAFEKDGKSIAAEPFDGFRIDYSISFPHPAIGDQRIVVEITRDSFMKEIARARTFGFLKEVEYLRSRGLARGGALENVVVVGDEGVVNEGGLRFPDEFVRHKVLDFIGDMAMLGMPLEGSFTVSRSGHAHNNAFLRRLASEEGALEIVTR
ncbi:MAG: UDP-3-O-acyl-N-acetylglucosamine deacetylase [Mailhella sp.]|nr:UDP-3-O-acyl-N-acetylglucosamine deacetylase [Mailhella sp.]